MGMLRSKPHWYVQRRVEFGNWDQEGPHRGDVIRFREDGASMATCSCSWQRTIERPDDPPAGEAEVTEALLRHLNLPVDTQGRVDVAG